MIRKAVIPAAGVGTRLLSATKEQPKEMLPVFSYSNGALCLKPMVQLIFEQLYDFGIREFLFIVGKGKRSIEDHFIPDNQFIESLDHMGKSGQARGLEDFYAKVRSSSLMWVNQAEPRGFGHAVFQAKPLIKGEPFLVHAGDTHIISNSNYHLKRLVDEYQSSAADAALTLQDVDDPRQYGVAEVEASGPKMILKNVIEKPDNPKTNLAIMPVYIFTEDIFEALRTVRPGKGGEIQLTDGIQTLINSGAKVVAIKLNPEELRLDIGTPETYWQAQRLSYAYMEAKMLHHD